MVEERTAESSHEKIVGQYVFFRDVPERQFGAVIVAHDQRTGIRVGDKAVVLAAIDLHLVFIETVPQIVGDDTEFAVEAFRIVDGERPVRQLFGLRLGNRRGDTFSGEPVPNRRQFLEHRAVAVDLGGVCRSDVLQAVGAGEMAVKIVEAAVLRVDHHDSIDAVDAGRLSSRHGDTSDEHRQQRRRPFQQMHHSNSPCG